MNFFLLSLLLLSSEVLFTYASDFLPYSQLEQYQGVRYLTYTRKNRTNSVDIRDVNFNDDQATVFIVHGFESKNLHQPIRVKDDIFQFNLEIERVIIVSWMEYSHASASTALKAPTNYNQVVQYHVPRLARDLSEKMVHIRENGAKGAIEVIGHSVGAHVAGQTGRILKNETQFTLDKIVGLDPAGHYFKENRNSALQNEDAKNVIRLHTNANVYGFGSINGPNDQKVNGGERQPNCKINVDFCSHNEAWNAYSQLLRNKLVEENKVHMHPYVICLDVSGSMNHNERLERAIHAAERVISSLKKGSFIGLVKFNDDAMKVNDIIQIKGSEERETLLSSLQVTADGSTSIGGGLRLSMNMLQAMPNSTTFCSTIVLISDGEQNSGESPEDVLPDLLKHCIAVNSIGLGKDASDKLEEISSATKGLVAYASEDGTSKDLFGITRALSYLFEKEIEETVLLKSEEVTVSSEEQYVHFTIDDTTGKDTEFKIVTYDIANLDVKMTSPYGEIFSSTSSEYFYDNFTEKGFRFPYAEEGEWTLTILKISKRKRSIRSTYYASVVGTTNGLDDKPTIRLTADVSDRVLEYPKPVTVTGELKLDEFPIIHAQVFANIEAPNQPVIRLPLYDNGVYPDELSNDGLYTNNVIKLPSPERYSVIVTATSNGTALLAPTKINYFLKNQVDCEAIACTKLKGFQRETVVGSIKLISNDKRDQIPPHRVSDLRAMVEDVNSRIISLEWTSPSDDFFDIQIKRYDIRVCFNGIDFENGLKLDESHIVKGSLYANNSTNEMEKISIRIPRDVWYFVIVNNKQPKFWPELKFILKSVGLNDETSEVSNIASVIVKERGKPVAVVEHIQRSTKVCKNILKRHRIVGLINVKLC